MKLTDDRGHLRGEVPRIHGHGGPPQLNRALCTVARILNALVTPIASRENSLSVLRGDREFSLDGEMHVLLS